MEDDKKEKINPEPKVDTIKPGQMTESAKQATMGARAFYFILYFFFYWTVYLYPNKLVRYLTEGDYFWFVAYFSIHGATIWYFMTTHRNPGIVEPDHVKIGSALSVSSDDEEEDIEGGKMNKTTTELVQEKDVEEVKGEERKGDVGVEQIFKSSDRLECD